LPVEQKLPAPHICRVTAKASTPPETPATPSEKKPATPAAVPATRPREIGGPKGPEPTRYGDWEYGGRCTDF